MISLIKKIVFKTLLFLATPPVRADLLRRSGLNIGRGSEVYRNVTFGSEAYLIKIGEKVRITSGVKFINHDGGLWVLRNKKMVGGHEIIKPIIIGDNVHIGIDSIIMPGVVVGDNVVIGVSSVVTKNIPSGSVVAGVPARFIKSIDQYGANALINGDETKFMTCLEKQSFYIKKYESLIC